MWLIDYFTVVFSWLSNFVLAILQHSIVGISIILVVICIVLNEVLSLLYGRR